MKSVEENLWIVLTIFAIILFAVFPPLSKREPPQSQNGRMFTVSEQYVSLNGVNEELVSILCDRVTGKEYLVVNGTGIIALESATSQQARDIVDSCNYEHRETD